MNITTLRNWGGAVAVSLPKKLLAVLGLKAGSEVEVTVENGKITLSPAKSQLTLAQLEKEQRALERKAGGRLKDEAWTGGDPKGQEEI
jgi:AbrB family looped-hinge helix DNA binding protein